MKRRKKRKGCNTVPEPGTHGSNIRKRGERLPSVSEINRLVRKREIEEETLIRLRLLRMRSESGHAYEHMRHMLEMGDVREKSRREAEKWKRDISRTEKGLKRDIRNLDEETSEDIKILEKSQLPISEELKRLKRIRALLAEEERRIEQMEKGILPGNGKKTISLNRQQRAWLNSRKALIDGQIKKIDTFLKRIQRTKKVRPGKKGGKRT